MFTIFIIIIIIIIMSLDFKKGVFLLHTSLFCNIIALLLSKMFKRLIYLTRFITYLC
jgi:hypothetical protein